MADSCHGQTERRFTLSDNPRPADLEANEANLVQLGDHLRTPHKAGGGLILP